MNSKGPSIFSPQRVLQRASSHTHLHDHMWEFPHAGQTPGCKVVSVLAPLQHCLPTGDLFSLPWELTAWLHASQRQKAAWSPYLSLHLFDDISPWSRRPWVVIVRSWMCVFGGGGRTGHTMWLTNQGLREQNWVSFWDSTCVWDGRSLGGFSAWGQPSRTRAVGR